MELNSSLTVHQDVVDLILDILANEPSNDLDQQSQKALTACLFVSSAFWQSARTHVFKQVTWREPFSFSLFEIFENDPLRDVKPLTNYVRKITIVVNPEALPIAQDELYDPWVSLSHILARAINLEALSLQPDTDDHSLNWDKLHPTTRDVITNKCHSLTTLQFCGITNFPLELLADCDNLRELHVIDLGMVTEKQCEWNQNSLRQLEVLNVDNTTGILPRFQATPPGALSKLKHFKYRPYGHWTEKTEILRRATASLKLLSLSDVVRIPGTLHGIKLSEFTALRSLCVRSETVPFDDELPVFPTSLLNSLITDLEPNSITTIEEIRIELSVFILNIPAYDDYRELLREERWSDIDKTLIGPHYPALKKIHFAFWDTYPGYKDAKWNYQETEASKRWFRDRVRRILPRTYSSSIETEVEHFVFGMRVDSHEPDW